MTLSVLMSVYSEDDNRHFARALKSVWEEQQKKPDEIVLVKDGALTPELEATVREWQCRLEDVLVVVELHTNVGLAAALNEGLKYCSHELVARMDSDDISLPHRFAKQLEFMEVNPDIAVSSGWVAEFEDEFSESHSIRFVPMSHQQIKRFAIRRNPMSHPAVIFRKEAVLSVGGYPNFQRSQDYALWTLMLHNGYRMANLQEVVLRMRAGQELLQRRGFHYLKHEIALLRYQTKIGFLNQQQFLTNMAIRTIVRMQPNAIKKLLYKYAR
jgi:glycosyltransferase involved in cell wall biosynthesis